MELGLFDQAERELHVVARSTPDNLAARRALGDLYWRQGELGRALEQLRTASGLAPGDGELAELVRELEAEVAAQGPAPLPEPEAAEVHGDPGVELPGAAAVQALERFYRAIVKRRAASQAASVGTDELASPNTQSERNRPENRRAS
jgi:hypothetical protein